VNDDEKEAEDKKLTGMKRTHDEAANEGKGGE
jgi:hypothetical protein